MVRATKPAIALHSETGLVGVRVRCPESTQRDSEVHRRGTEGGSLGRKHRRKVTAGLQSRNRHASQTGGSAGAFRWRKEKHTRRATSRPRAYGDGPLAVPSQLVIEVGFEGGVWRQASTTGGRPESYRAEVQARA